MSTSLTTGTDLDPFGDRRTPSVRPTAVATTASVEADAGVDPDADVPAYSRRQRQLVLTAMCVSLALVVASVSMLNVALPTLATALGASQSAQQWIADGYAIALAALLLPFGALGDRYGRKGALVAGITIFGGAAAASVFVTSTGPLIALRILAGVGAALIMPGTLSTITSVFPANERAKAVGVWAGFAGAGGVLGMIASGFLLEHFFWGSIFVVNAVVAAIALAATLFAVPNSKESTHVSIDVVGSVLSVAAIGSFVFSIIEGPHRGWSDTLTVAGLVVGVAAGISWVVWSLRTESPLLDPRLFRLRGFATGSAALFLQFFAMFGLFFVALQFLQLMLNYGTFKASLAILPVAAVMLPLSTVAATLAERWGQRVVGTIGLSITAVGFVTMAAMNTGSGYTHFVIAMMMVGVGMALAMTPSTNAIVGSLPREKQGVASAVNDTSRELGAAFGIAVLGSAFNSGYHTKIDSVVSTLPAQIGSVVRESPAAGIVTARKMGDAGSALLNQAREGFIVGMRWALLVGAAMLVIGAAFTWLRAPRHVSAADLGDEPTTGELELELELEGAGVPV